jgi:ATP-binding cassette subfamily B multidrug efflux pump
MNVEGGLKPFAIRYSLPLWRWYLAGFFALAATNVITLEIPHLAKSIVNALTEKTVTIQNTLDLSKVALLIIALGLLQVLIRSLSRILVFWPGRSIEANCRTDAFDHLISLPQRALLRFGMGDLISRLANDIGQLRVFFAFGLLQVLNLAFLSIFIITRMLTIHVGLTLACLAPLALMVVITRYAMPKLQEYSRLNQEATGRLTNRVTEAFVHVHVVQQSGAESSFLDRTAPDNDAVYRSNMRLVFIRNAVFPLMSCLASIGQMTVIFYGGYEAIHNRLTVGDILAFNVYIGFLSFPLTAVGMIIAMYQRALTAVQRLDEINQTKVETVEPSIQGRLITGTGESILSVRDLAFSYENDSRKFGLSGISFELPAGRKIGIAGAVGSGKTTLLQLLVRLFDPPSGKVFLDGRDVLSIPTHELRTRVGMASQTVHLFSAPVIDNMCFGLHPAPGTPLIRKALEEAMILREIESLPEGLQTEIGEKGIRLSGGQKQRLALARLFLRHYDVLILDDVLSAVDQVTESALIQNILKRGCAMIIASHRTSVLKACDEILILEGGRIKAQGSWPEVQHLAGDLSGTGHDKDRQK